MNKGKSNRNRTLLLMASILALILAAFCVSADCSGTSSSLEIIPRPIEVNSNMTTFHLKDLSDCEGQNMRIYCDGGDCDFFVDGCDCTVSGGECSCQVDISRRGWGYYKAVDSGWNEIDTTGSATSCGGSWGSVGHVAQIETPSICSDWTDSPFNLNCAIHQRNSRICGTSTYCISAEGMAYDGRTLWVTHWGNTVPLRQIEIGRGTVANGIITVDPSYMNLSNVAEVTWDGSYLWVLDRYKGLYKYNITPEVLETHNFSKGLVKNFDPDLNNMDNLAYGGGYLWMADIYGGACPFDACIAKIDPDTEAVIFIEYTAGGAPYSLTWKDGYLYATDWGGSDIRRINPNTGELVEVIVSPFCPGGATGITVYGNSFMVACGQQVYCHTIDNSPPTVTLISPGDNYGTEEGDLTVTFKQVDDVSLTCSCSLYLDGSLIQTNPSVSNNTPTSFTITGITAGTHHWTVKCTDDGGNTGSPYYVIFGSDHLYQSNDDGQNWQQLGEGYLNPPFSSGGYWNIYALDSTSYGRLFISFRYGNYYDCDGLASAIGYLHEAAFKRNSESNIMQMIDGDCLNRNFRKIYSVAEALNGDLYAATGGIFRSVDKGAFWDPVLGSADVYSLAVTSNGHIFASSTTGVYRSTDDGQTFNLLPGSPTTSEYQHTGNFIASAGNDVYVASDRRVWKSDDDGNSWSNVFTSWSAILSLYAYNGNYILAGIRQDDENLGAIYRSTDAGASWQPVLMQQQIRDETGSEEGWVQAIDRTPAGDIYASVEGPINGRGLLYRSNDSGDSWELLLDESRPPSGGPVLVDGVENVHRSFTVPTWPHVGRYISHKSSTSKVGDMSVAYEKWNRDLGLHEPWSGAVTADVTGNGRDEIALVSDRLYLLDGEGNTLWGKICGINWVPTPSCDDTWYNGQIPTIGDVDGDGLAEIVFRGWRTELICRDAITGFLEWFIPSGTLELGSGTVVTPVIADVTGDGLAEVIVHGTKLYVLDGSDGSVLWSKDIRTEDTVPAVGDLDGNGLMDIVVKEDMGALLHAFDGAGNKLWESTVQIDYNLVTGYITIADVDGDDKPEVIDVSWGELFVFNGEDGSSLWSKPYGEFDGQEAVNYLGSSAVGDIDGDGRMEIALGLSGRDTHPAQGLYVLNGEDGSILWRNQSIGQVNGAPAVADIDGDGGLEVIVQTDKVYAFNADGTLLWEYPIGGESNIALADVDGDDYIEVIAVSDGRVYVLDGISMPMILKNVTLTYSVADDQSLVNCSLWTNISTNWQIDQTNTTIINGGINSFRIANVALGVYLWNVQCFNDIGQYAFAFRNWTFTVV